MGCDIYAVIEYQDEFGVIQTFNSKGLNLSRDYELFTFLALGESGLVDELLFPPRGLPLDYTQAVREQFFVNAKEKLEIFKLFSDEEFNPDELEEWEKKEYFNNGLLANIDFHSASWLNFHELKQVLNHYNFKTESLSADWQKVLSAMKDLSNNYGAENARLVFWFDGID